MVSLLKNWPQTCLVESPKFISAHPLLLKSVNNAPLHRQVQHKFNDPKRQFGVNKCAASSHCTQVDFWFATEVVKKMSGCQ
jgi:hypothetical protein